MIATYLTPVKKKKKKLAQFVGYIEEPQLEYMLSYDFE